MDHTEHPTEPADPAPESAGLQVLADAPRLARRWRSIPTGRLTTDELVIGPGRRILHVGTGDSPARAHGPVDLGPAGPDPTGIIADWLGLVAGSAVGAFVLEPVDPTGQLDEHERSSWIPTYPNRLDGVSFHLDDQALQTLRTCLLAQDARYAEVATALKDPRAPHSQQALADLRSAAFSAAYGAARRELQQLQHDAAAPSRFATCQATVQRAAGPQQCGMTLDNHGTCPNTPAHLP